MQFLGALVKLFLLFGSLLGVIFFGGRELALLIARISLDSTVTDALNLVQNPGKYYEACAQQFGGSGEVLAGFQVRFFNASQYALEAVCSFDRTKPLTIEERELPLMVKKLPGSSGLYFSRNLPSSSSIQLRLLGRAVEASYAQEGEAIVAQAPAAACQGWGYGCCDSISEVGAGAAPNPPAVDCSGNCFAQCKKRPSVYSFNADPSFNQVTRIVSIRPGTLVRFFYVIGDQDGQIVDAVLNFGDGKQTELTQDNTGTGFIDHEYACSGTCDYTATISLTDSDGYSAPQSAVSSMEIEVR